MAIRNVVLTDHQEKLIEDLVSSGRFQNASEVLREGLRLVEQRESENKDRLKYLRLAVRLSIADVDAGRFRDFKSNADLRAHLDSLVQRRPAGQPTVSERVRRWTLRLSGAAKAD